MISNRPVATPPGAPLVNQDATYFDDSRLLFEECWIPSTSEEYPQVSSFSTNAASTSSSYYQPYYNGTYGLTSSDTTQAVRVDQVFTTFVSSVTPQQQTTYSPTYRPQQTYHSSPSPTPKISTPPTTSASPIFVTNLPTPSPPPVIKQTTATSPTAGTTAPSNTKTTGAVARKEKKGQGQRKKEVKANGTNHVGGETIQKKRKLKKKKTAKACVYCRHSHSCCDNFRPCNKCTARGIGHLCKESETSSITSVNKIVKEMKKKKKKSVQQQVNNEESHEQKPESIAKSTLLPDSPSSPLISLPPPSPSIFDSVGGADSISISLPLPMPIPISISTIPEVSSFPREILSTLNNARRPFPKDLCLSFHRLAKKSGWTSELIKMWFKTEEFYRWKRVAETISFFGYREAVMKGVYSILPTLNESSEPTILWAEGLRLFGGNTAALKFFNCSFDAISNKAFGYHDDMEDYDGSEWSLESDIMESENVYRLFDFVHKDDAISFSCNAATDAMSLYPLDFYSSKDDPPTQVDVARGFRTKVRLSLTKEACNANSIVPLIKNMAHFSLNDNKKKSKKKERQDEDDYVVCLVTQSQYRDANTKRFLFASCTFNRIDDLE